MTKRQENIDLSTISAGTPLFFACGSETINKLFTAEIIQDTVSLAGVIITLVQSNSGANWGDILDADDLPISETTLATSDVVIIGTDYTELNVVGISVDVAGATTGDLIVYFNSRATI